ncbi:hypothetical protein JZ751_029838 [Albula glossodonta]|uniref:Uncharacterized protein n=1 Tax=Albula glossodonta TaxID=121402 RepID=A0A8T2NCQ6_9TELE|nr:hypothetical protein JZ751_029838 [Albula glossodonta]
MQGCGVRDVISSALELLLEKERDLNPSPHLSGLNLIKFLSYLIFKKDSTERLDKTCRRTGLNQRKEDEVRLPHPEA